MKYSYDYRSAMEHDSPDALKQYLKEHPDADRSNHTVKNRTPKDRVEKTVLDATAESRQSGKMTVVTPTRTDRKNIMKALKTLSIHAQQEPDGTLYVGNKWSVLVKD